MDGANLKLKINNRIKELQIAIGKADEKQSDMSLSANVRWMWKDNKSKLIERQLELKQLLNN